MPRLSCGGREARLPGYGSDAAARHPRQCNGADRTPSTTVGVVDAVHAPRAETTGEVVTEEDETGRDDSRIQPPFDGEPVYRSYEQERAEGTGAFRGLAIAFLLSLPVLALIGVGIYLLVKWIGG